MLGNCFSSGLAACHLDHRSSSVRYCTMSLEQLVFQVLGMLGNCFHLGL